MKIFGIIDNYDKASSGGMDYYLMADSSILHTKRPFFLPDFDADVRLHPSLTVRIERLGKTIAPRFARRYYHEVSVGLAVIGHEGLRRAKAEGRPWASCVAFDTACILGDTSPLSSEEPLPSFSVYRNGEEAAMWTPEKLLASADEVVAEVSRRFILKTGDIFFVGLDPEGFRVEIGDRITASLPADDEPSLQINVK